VDAVSGQGVHKAVPLQGFTPTLQSKLLKAKSAKDSRTLVLQFSDLLQKCLTLDPTRRIAVKMALQHDFFKDKAAPGTSGRN
jgi:serine/threonine-protein kinase PRP4